MKYGHKLIAFSLMLAAALSQADDKAPIDQQLETAIYTEQTLGELEQAAQLYKSIVEQNDANKKIVAEALMRLAQCQKKLGDEEAATRNLERLHSEFGQFASLTNAAESAVGVTVFDEEDLTPVPWSDGETLEYQVFHLDRRITAYQVQTKNAVNDLTRPGKVNWKSQLSIYQPPYDNAYWNMVTGDEGNHLISGAHKFLHLKGREFFASDTGITIKDLEQGTEYSVPKTKQQYDQGIVGDLTRRLPYRDGYQTIIDCIVNVKVKVKVISMSEPISVPAGDFDTIHIKLEYIANGSSAMFSDVWISNDRNRYAVRQTVGDNTTKLARIFDFDGAEEYTHKDEKGFSISLPTTWVAHYQDTADKIKKATHIHPIKSYETIATYYPMDVEDSDWATSNVNDLVDNINSWDYSWLKSYKFKEGSVETFTIDGRQAMSMEADVVFRNEPLTEYKIVVANKPKLFVFSFQTPTKHFADRKPVYDRIVKSLRF